MTESAVTIPLHPQSSTYAFDNRIVPIVQTDCILWVHSLADGRLDCFHLLTLNSAALDVRVSICLNTCCYFFGAYTSE